MLLLFSLFHLICFLKTGCFFHVICFLRTGCFFHVICFIKTGCFKCCLFWLLSILCFVVNNDLRQKIYFRFFSEIQYAVSDVTSFFPFFTSYVSSKLVAFFTSYVSLELVVFSIICICDILSHFFLYIQSDVFFHQMMMFSINKGKYLGKQKFVWKLIRWIVGYA